MIKRHWRMHRTHCPPSASHRSRHIERWGSRDRHELRPDRAPLLRHRPSVAPEPELLVQHKYVTTFKQSVPHPQPPDALWYAVQSALELKWRNAAVEDARAATRRRVWLVRAREHPASRPPHLAPGWRRSVGWRATTWSQFAKTSVFHN